MTDMADARAEAPPLPEKSPTEPRPKGAASDGTARTATAQAVTAAPAAKNVGLLLAVVCEIGRASCRERV